MDNNIIKKIIDELYYPQSHYLFSVIPIEVIWNAYERFLGKTITIGNNNKAKIELKLALKLAYAEA